VNDVLMRYMQCFLHPVESQKKVNAQTDNVVGIHGHEVEARHNHLSFEEGLVFSWLFALMQSFYTVLIMNLGLNLFPVAKSVASRMGKPYALQIFFIILEVVLFPLSYWFFTKFWSKVVFICSQMFSLEPEEGQVACEDIIIKAMSANALLVVPFFGQAFCKLLTAVYLFLGVKTRLGFSSLQAFIVMLVPFFILFLSTALMAVTLFISIAGMR